VSDVIITVRGTPAPQGSKRHVGKGVMIESSAAVKPWREAVKAAAMTEYATMTAEAVDVDIVFLLRRPKSHYGTGRNASTLRPGMALEAHRTKPDLDKLIRATLDALGDAGLWRDDSQVARITARKVYAMPAQYTGAIIRVREVTP